MKKIIAIFLTLAAVISLAACGAKAEKKETTVVDTTVVDTAVDSGETVDFYEVDWEVSNEEVQKKLLRDFPQDKETYLDENTKLVRVDRSFRIEYLKPKYSITFIGSVDVPTSYKGWGWNYEKECHPGKGCTFVINAGKVQSWTDCQLNWEVEIPNYKDQIRVEIIEVYENYVIVYNYTNSSIYLIYDEKIEEIGQDVLDVNSLYGDLIWITTTGEVYLLEDYCNNPDGEAELVAQNAIAITHSDSDAPGWYIEGDIDPEYRWVSKIKGEFVPSK